MEVPPEACRFIYNPQLDEGLQTDSTPWERPVERHTHPAHKHKDNDRQGQRRREEGEYRTATEGGLPCLLK